MSISIIIPTYKPGEYIWQCLDSLTRQTLTRELWEVIVVLNGCSEPWLERLQDYKAQHGQYNIRILQTDDSGVSNARNIGLDTAQGEYIGFIDDDDYVSPAYLEKLAHKATPDTIAASYTIAFDETHDYIPYYIETAYKSYAPKGIMPYYLARKYFSGPCMKLIHRDIIACRRFDTRFTTGEDALFMFTISNLMQTITFTGTEAVYYRRIREGSASHTKNWFQTTHNCLKLIAQYCRIYAMGKGYSFSFFTTRILGAIHTIISK